MLNLGSNQYEIADANAAPVRWAAMDGSDEGFDPKGAEQLSAKDIDDE